MRTTLVGALGEQSCAALLQLLNQLLLLLLGSNVLLLLLLGLHVRAAHSRRAAAGHLEPTAGLRQQRVRAVGGRWARGREGAACRRPVIESALVSSHQSRLPYTSRRS